MTYRDWLLRPAAPVAIGAVLIVSAPACCGGSVSGVEEESEIATPEEVPQRPPRAGRATGGARDRADRPPRNAPQRGDAAAAPAAEGTREEAGTQGEDGAQEAEGDEETTTSPSGSTTHGRSRGKSAGSVASPGGSGARGGSGSK